MEEKNVAKISLSTFLLILAIIAIIVMGIFIYKLNNDKAAEIQKSTELQAQVNNLNGTVSDLQGKINNISETINSSGNATNYENSNKENNTESLNENNTQNSNSQEISGIGYSATLQNNKITITLKSQEGLWSDSDFSKPINNRKYIVEGLDGNIKKIVAANMAQDVSPEILILMENGTVKYVNLSGPIIGTKNPDTIKFTSHNIPWATDLKNIVDIKVDGDYHYAIDNTGKEIKIWNNEA